MLTLICSIRSSTETFTRPACKGPQFIVLQSMVLLKLVNALLEGIVKQIAGEFLLRTQSPDARNRFLVPSLFARAFLSRALAVRHSFPTPAGRRISIMCEGLAESAISRSLRQKSLQ